MTILLSGPVELTPWTTQRGEGQLIDGGNNVLEFLSYEGSFTAADGPAVGRTSLDIGAAESGSTLVGQSLQRTGTGLVGSDFAFTGPSTASPGAVNAGQVFDDPPPRT
jgi:hypothetical protein